MKAVQREWAMELVLGVTAVVCHAVAFAVDSWGILIVGYLTALFMLTRFGSVRRGFYLGLVIGTISAGVHLHFFFSIFGGGAIALWAILGLWIAAFIAIMRGARLQLSRWWIALIPFVWVGLEYTRSELYPLRFSWLAPGMALSHPRWNGWVSIGFYGFGFAVMALLALLSARAKWRTKVWTVALLLATCCVLGMKERTTEHLRQTPYVSGIQFEFASESQVLKGLDRLLTAHPSTDVAVLSEYTFSGPIPQAVLEWCRMNDVYLIAGGKEEFGDGPNDFRNQVFIVDPSGEVVHKQVKSVPIQFFQDGEPAKEQALWSSPWGPIGIAICYDLSYSLVMDRFISAGAGALIVPTMDVEEWGDYQHSLHAKIPYVRAREYNVPIFRLASSGVSQLVTADGETVASAPCPGPGRMLGGYMTMSNAGRVPPMRWIAKLSVAIVIGVMMLLLWRCHARKTRRL